MATANGRARCSSKSFVSITNAEPVPGSSWGRLFHDRVVGNSATRLAADIKSNCAFRGALHARLTLIQKEDALAALGAEMHHDVGRVKVGLVRGRQEQGLAAKR